PVGAVHVAELEVPGQHLQPGRRELLGYEYDGHWDLLIETLLAAGGEIVPPLPPPEALVTQPPAPSRMSVGRRCPGDARRTPPAAKSLSGARRQPTPKTRTVQRRLTCRYWTVRKRATWLSPDRRGEARWLPGD